MGGRNSMLLIFPYISPNTVAILRGADETVEARCSIEMVSVASGIFPVNLHKMAPVTCRLAQNERPLSESCQMASCKEILPGHLFWKSCTETLHRDARPYTYCILWHPIRQTHCALYCRLFSEHVRQKLSKINCIIFVVVVRIWTYSAALRQATFTSFSLPCVHTVFKFAIDTRPHSETIPQTRPSLAIYIIQYSMSWD